MARRLGARGLCDMGRPRKPGRHVSSSRNARIQDATSLSGLSGSACCVENRMGRVGFWIPAFRGNDRRRYVVVDLNLLIR